MKLERMSRNSKSMTKDDNLKIKTSNIYDYYDYGEHKHIQSGFDYYTYIVKRIKDNKTFTIIQSYVTGLNEIKAELEKDQFQNYEHPFILNSIDYFI